MDKQLSHYQVTMYTAITLSKSSLWPRLPSQLQLSGTSIYYITTSTHPTRCLKCPDIRFLFSGTILYVLHLTHPIGSFKTMNCIFNTLTQCIIELFVKIIQCCVVFCLADKVIKKESKNKITFYIYLSFQWQYMCRYKY